ncbi:DUF4910 domain-containing protein [Aminobacter sp. HY435]|uniref:DUF4910 domain-containing protein n=1 Tax=Aminobacter sp. HY435 TaxID=2970917 RepID=UPI0022B968BC|nr:DUF4910 domain-containing protein [Aminobacter sp. HY435]
MEHQPAIADPPLDAVGEAIYGLARQLYPICRSITGDGVRQSLAILGGTVPLDIHEVATGTAAFDWTIPREWLCRSATVTDSGGHVVLDFADHNLHVLNYSMPFSGTVSLDELKRHTYSLPDQPDLIPYRTSYYAENWGLCMQHSRLARLPEGMYRVEIDTEFKDGSLSYGEYLHRGETDREFLLSAHICHPSLANDNCSGLALLASLANHLRSKKTRYSYRFLFAPGTIGSLAWLSRNEDKTALIDHGLVVSCVGDGGGPTYKRSRRGNAYIDRAMAHVLAHRAKTATLLDFSPYGYDERQFCSPGFDLPVGLFQRSAFGTFPEYHTSADNLDFIKPLHLAWSWRIVMDVVEIVEGDWTPVSQCQKGEPQLGRRGLYAALGGDKSTGLSSMSLLWVLNLADGTNSLLAMAERSGLSFRELAGAAKLLRLHGLLS